MTEKLIAVDAQRPSEHAPKPLPRLRRRLAERGLDRRRPPAPVPFRKGRRVKQSPTTGTEPAGLGEEHRIEFSEYTPLGTPTNGGLVPPDASGADSSPRVVLHTGNSYLMASTDGGATFTEHDTTKFLPAAVGRPVDQVMIYVPHRRLFAWMMQHERSSGGGDGNFRLAVADAEDLSGDIEGSWTVYDFTSSDLGAPKTATDRQDLAFGESRLYMTTNLSGKGRVVMTLDLDDLAERRTVHWGRTEPLEAKFQFSDLSQQNSRNVVHSVAIATSSTLRVMTLDDGAGTYGYHDVKVGQFPVNADLASLDPDGVDWLTAGVSNVSASVIQGSSLWTAWDAAASAKGDTPFYPHAHVRLARINTGTWKVIEEMQVWNPDYAFAYGCLAIGPDGEEVGYGVGVGGPHDYPNSCFGILGDFVVYFRDSSTATPSGKNGAGDTEFRWGDYITVRPSARDRSRFSAFGYFSKKVGTGASQRPFYLEYGRP
jgi:hypothetical protein